MTVAGAFALMLVVSVPSAKDIGVALGMEHCGNTVACDRNAIRVRAVHCHRLQFSKSSDATTDGLATCSYRVVDAARPVANASTRLFKYQWLAAGVEGQEADLLHGQWFVAPEPGTPAE